MVYQRRSHVSTVFCPRHNNSVVRRWSCFPEMLKIARNKRRSSCRRTVGDRWSHRAIGISFADSYPRSYRCKKCRWDIDMDTPVVRRWILRDISKEVSIEIYIYIYKFILLSYREGISTIVFLVKKNKHLFDKSYC